MLGEDRLYDSKSSPLFRHDDAPSLIHLACQPVEKVPKGWLVAGVALWAPLTLASLDPPQKEITPTMMGIKERNFRPLPNLSLEELVPQENFYRHLQRTLDLSFVRELVIDCYAAGGRPSVDPVVFFKLQLVLFFEGLRSERQLMTVVADRLSIRWYLGYDLHESLPDHSSLTKIRDRYGLGIFRRFFEEIVQKCIEAGLVWGEELYFDATKVEANASLESITPRFAVEQHLQDLFEEDAQEEPDLNADGAPRTTAGDLDHLPYSNDDELISANAARSDWITKAGRQDREVKGNFYRRKADLFLSKTDPDASPMKRKGADHSHLGYPRLTPWWTAARHASSWASWSPPSRLPRTSPCWTCYGGPSSGGGAGLVR
jgi:transposase